jgi:hypothetical protein
METVTDGEENDTVDENIVKPVVNADSTVHKPEDHGQVLTVNQTKEDNDQTNTKDGKQPERPKTGRSRPVDQYIVNFCYLQSADSARDLMRTHAPTYAGIVDEKRLCNYSCLCLHYMFLLSGMLKFKDGDVIYFLHKNILNLYATPHYLLIIRFG